MTPKIPGYFIGLLLCGSVFAADLPDHPFIFVTGAAEHDMPPNIAECSLRIHAIDQDSAKAEATIDGRLKSVLAALAAGGVAADDIESFIINKRILSSGFVEKEAAAAIRGYDLTRNVHFKVRKIASLPAIEGGFIGSPNVEEISCQFDRTDRVALGELLIKAVQDGVTT